MSDEDAGSAPETQVEPPADPAPEARSDLAGEDPGESAPESVPAPESFVAEYRGTALGLLPLHLFRLFSLAGLCLTLPLGLGRAVVDEVHGLLDPLGAGAQLGEVEAGLGTLPLVPSLIASLLLVLLFLTANGWIWRYRLQNTWVHGGPIGYRPGCNPFVGILSILLVVSSSGVLAPWVFTWSRRRLYRRCHTAKGPMAFSGSAIGIASYGVLSLLALPLAFMSFGLAWVLPRYLWLRWEQDNLLVPDADGQPCATQWDGTFFGYLRFVLLRWALTLLTLGLLHPWALTATWRWAAEHTRFTPRPQGSGLRERLASFFPKNSEEESGG